MASQKEFLLRYRESGHMRFEIPPRFCNTELANSLIQELQAVDGIYRVKVYKSQGKLSIRYLESVRSFAQVAKHLHQIVGRLEKQSSNDTARSNKVANAKTREKKHFRLTGWFRQKYGDAKETLQAAKILSNSGLHKKLNVFKDPEKAAIDFFNDVLVLYLIKLHWERITKQWLPKPFTYRYEWMAVFYLIFLLMRSKRPK